MERSPSVSVRSARLGPRRRRHRPIEPGRWLGKAGELPRCVRAACSSLSVYTTESELYSVTVQLEPFRGRYLAVIARCVAGLIRGKSGGRGRTPLVEQPQMADPIAAHGLQQGS